jgi:hypothetical protein
MQSFAATTLASNMMQLMSLFWLRKFTLLKIDATKLLVVKGTFPFSSINPT